MNDEDVALFRQAEQLAESGNVPVAHDMFCTLRERNPTQIEVLFWVVATTSNPMEARQTIDTIRSLQPSHPKLRELEAFHQRRLQKPSVPMMFLGPVLFCPYCGFRGPAIVRDKISTGGWVVFAVVLFVFFPLCWIGLLIKENYYVCRRCWSRIAAMS